MVTTQSAVLALQRVTHRTLLHLTVQLDEHGLTASEMNVLANLCDGSTPTVSRLGAAAGIRPTTLTSVLDRLEGRGYLTRTTRAADRRASSVELTAGGRAVANAVGQAFAALEHTALTGVPKQAIVGFHRVLAALEAAS